MSSLIPLLTHHYRAFKCVERQEKGDLTCCSVRHVDFWILPWLFFCCCCFYCSGFFFGIWGFLFVSEVFYLFVCLFEGVVGFGFLWVFGVFLRNAPSDFSFQICLPWKKIPFSKNKKKKKKNPCFLYFISFP